jgi:hypothetical protein
VVANAPKGDAGCAAGQGEDRFAEELGAYVSFGRAERTAKPDLGAAFEDGDDHDVGDTDGPDVRAARPGGT